MSCGLNGLNLLLFGKMVVVDVVDVGVVGVVVVSLVLSPRDMNAMCSMLSSLSLSMVNFKSEEAFLLDI